MLARLSFGTRLSLVTLAFIGLLVAIATFAELDLVMQMSLCFAFGVLALSLGFIWGYGGVFSFGQTAFFGIGGYAYAAAAINLGGSTTAILIAIAIPGLLAAIFGYFVFYARLNSMYVAVITLVITLILFKFMGQTAKPAYMIGNAMLGGYNGMPAIPPLNLPFRPDISAGPMEMFWIAGIVLLACWLGLHLLLRCRFGRIVVGIRENETRMELLGYDVRFYKMLAFSLAAMLAALGGVLFVNWNAFIDPQIFSLSFSAQPIIWVMIGGLGTLEGPILGAFILSALTLELGTQKLVDVNLILGLIFTLFVLLVPQGIIPTILKILERRAERKAAQRLAAEPLPENRKDD